tara:strand:- start:552 stop:1316 length:765 start_codon:yes stop_codon:yes gene_type:complete
MKSPIKENINRFKSLAVLKELIPKGSVIDSYFLFSGELEFKLAEAERFVIGHTNKYVVYEFWKCALEDPVKIEAMARYLYPIGTSEAFHTFQAQWHTYKDEYARSALFFLLNRCSESGWISAGRFNDENLNPIAFSYLKKFSPKNFFLTFDDSPTLIETLPQGSPQSDYRLFPIGQFNYNLLEYGRNTGLEMTRVYHKRFREALEEVKDKWIVLYKYHPQAHTLYKDCNIRMIDKYGRETQEKEQCEEMIIANF